MDDLIPVNKGTRLAIEYGARLRLEIAGVEVPLESRMVGMEGEYLIITAPPNPQGALEHKIFEGNEMVVRYLSNGTVYSFQSKLRTSTSKPLQLLFLEYPKVVQKDELRSRRRANCMIPATFAYRGEKRDGMIIDISTTGCRGTLHGLNRKQQLFHLDTGKNLQISCKFPGVKVPAVMHGEVRSVKKNQQKLTLGIQFTRETPNDSLRLVAWYISTVENYLCAAG